MDLEFDPHARDRMRRRHLPEAAAYHVVGDADEIVERLDGRTEYRGTWEGRRLLVVTEGDAEPLYVVSVIEVEQRRRRRQRR